MISFKKLQTYAYPVLKEQKATEDSVYWKNLQFPVTIKQIGAVTSIDFSLENPYNYLICSSTKVQLYSPRNTLEPLKSYHKFKDVVHSASFRSDGQLFVVACEDKHVRVVHKKHFEQIFNGHTSAVHVSRFVGDHKIYSASDDKSVKIWDIATTKVVNSYQEHSDYVRCGSKTSMGQLFAVGSYDKTIRLYDPRCSASVMLLNHHKPLESVIMLPTANIIASAGGTSVKVWDVVAGGRMLVHFNNHHKTITSLSLCMQNKRIVSASLDRHVKMYDLSKHQCVHSLDYDHPLLSVAFPLDDSVVVVGSTDGMLSVRTRKMDQEIEKEREEKRIRKKRRSMEGGERQRAVVVVDGGVDVFVAHKARELMPKYETRLRKFQHSRALTEALTHNLRVTKPEVALCVMRELRRRRVLRGALAGRTDKQLCVILTFLLKNFKPPHLQDVCDVLSILLDVYKDTIADMPQSRQLINKMNRAFKERVEFAKEGLELLGSINTLLNVSSLNS